MADLISRDAALAALNWGDIYGDNAQAAIRALPAVQPVVKPLVWEQFGSSYRAKAPLFGHIRIEDYASGKWAILWSAPGICDTFTPGGFDDPEAAKAAAQADYEHRILSALDFTPMDASAIRAQALREAAQVLNDEIEIARIAMPHVIPILSADRRAILTLIDKEASYD